MDIATCWIVGGIAGIVLELLLPGFVVIFFGGGAVVAGLVCLAFPALPMVWQLAIFIASSVLMLVLFRKMLKQRFFTTPEAAPDELAEEYIGHEAVALQDFADGYGKVEFKGCSWSATSADEIHTGDRVEIIKRESIKLTVKKL